MPRTRSDWLILTAVVAVVGFVWLSMTRGQTGTAIPSPDGQAARPEVGYPAPDFTLATLDGGTLTLSELRGQPVVLNFWATWCPPCRTEIPALEQVYTELDGDVLIIGVDVQEDPAEVAAFAQEIGMTYPVALDTQADVARLYQVRAYPTTYFINAEGTIVRVFTGPLNEPLLYTRLTEIGGR